MISLRVAEARRRRTNAVQCSTTPGEILIWFTDWYSVLTDSPADGPRSSDASGGFSFPWALPLGPCLGPFPFPFPFPKTELRMPAPLVTVGYRRKGSAVLSVLSVLCG